MRIDRITLWVKDLEKMKKFYTHYFGAEAGQKYINKRKGFSSYFLEFQLGEARIALMQHHDATTISHQKRTHSGLSHFTIGIGSEEKLYELVAILKAQGIAITQEPGLTGEGYLESILLDPECNTVALTV